MTDAVMGAIIGVGIFIVICLAWTNYSKTKLEGFASGKTPADVVKKIKTTNNDLSDILNKLKYRSSYEDIILEAESWATDTQLQLLSAGVIGVSSIDDSIEHVRRFNELKTFKTNLNELINVLDST